MALPAVIYGPWSQRRKGLIQAPMIRLRLKAGMPREVRIESARTQRVPALVYTGECNHVSAQRKQVAVR